MPFFGGMSLMTPVTDELLGDFFEVLVQFIFFDPGNLLSPFPPAFPLLPLLYFFYFGIPSLPATVIIVDTSSFFFF